MSRRIGVWNIIPGMGLLVAALFIPLISPALAGEELAIGEMGPEFDLKGTDMEMHSLEDVARENGTAVIFTCNMCPFSKGYEDRLIELAKSYQAKGIGFVAINPNDPEIVPGMKMWTFGKKGTRQWAELLSNGWRGYAEVQSGAFQTQEEFGSLEPNGEVRFIEFWRRFL